MSSVKCVWAMHLTDVFNISDVKCISIKTGQGKLGCIYVQLVEKQLEKGRIV